MIKKTTLTQFVQEQIERFGIDDNPKTINKIRIKCTRVLKDLNAWDNAETQLIGRKQTKVFDQDQLSKLYSEIEPYLIKISNIDLDDYNEYLSKYREYMDKMLAGNYEDDIDEEQYMAPRVTKEEMRDVMVEALFNLYYEPLDIKQWEKDKALTFYTDPIDADNIEYYQAVKRLNNPLQSYTTPKK
ncbi:hypothetical protein LXO72_10040 [Streptococcus sp. XMC]|uniref:hypothetical protein n=1 Tax=Streptococcus sp. XMC TaxID=2905972 RepID=UPI001E477800|nr:hypothetical protein [Streptococcus sp. XMC]MCE3592696.1 hypothetical protein [Streptococcus sp. XMC]